MTADNRQQPRLIDEFREQQKDLIRALGPGAIVALIAFAIAFYFVEPSPPRRIVIAAGKAEGGYFAAAKDYAELFARSGIELDVKVTAGSIENYQLLADDNDVELAIVQGGTVPDDSKLTDRLESIASIYLEPVFVFYRSEQPLTELRQLQGHRVAIGNDGSGTAALARQLLEENGVTHGSDETQFMHQGGHAAAKLLKAGEIDAAFIISAPDSRIITELLQADEVRLMSFARQHAYSRRHPYLRSVVLEQGVIDLERNLPPQSVKLIAPAANLVATTDFHDAFIPLLLEAATATHGQGGFLVETGIFPSLKHVEFPPNESARHYIDDGPSFFQKHLSFWVASLIDRTMILAIPLAVLLIPLAKLAPPVYRWRIRSRIYRWYGILREIDQKLRHGKIDDTGSPAETLKKMERELEQVSVPLSYMQEFYQLRLHLDLVQRRVARYGADQAKAQPQTNSAK